MNAAAIRLYTAQDETVIATLKRDGVSFSKKDYVSRKYGQVAPVFLAAYSWFAGEATRFVPRPAGAELHYWTFTSTDDFEIWNGSRLLTLDVPVSECIFFNVFDWNKILKLQYMGEDEQEEKHFREQLRDYGIKHDSDILLTNFYPELKHQITDSWQKLFRHHSAIAAGERPFTAIEAALWQIKAEWIGEVRD